MIDSSYIGAVLPERALPDGYGPFLLPSVPVRETPGPPPPKKPAVRIGDKLWTQREREFIDRQALQYYRRIYPSIPVLLVDRDRTEVDSLTHETIRAVWHQPLYIPAHLQWSPAQDILDYYGIKRAQEVLVSIPTVVLKICRIDPPELLYGAVMPLIVGDQKEPVQYSVLSVHQEPRDAWSPIGDILEIAVTTERRTQRQNMARPDIPTDRFAGFTGDFG